MTHRTAMHYIWDNALLSVHHTPKTNLRRLGGFVDSTGAGDLALATRGLQCNKHLETSHCRRQFVLRVLGHEFSSASELIVRGTRTSYMSDINFSDISGGELLSSTQCIPHFVDIEAITIWMHIRHDRKRRPSLPGVS